MAGTYTIGGTSPDYATFTNAVNDLLINGICGPVIFSIRSGTYTESILLPAGLTTSAVNTVTFISETGDSSSVMLSYNSGYTVNIAAGYIEFTKLSINSIGGTGGIFMDVSSNNITVNNCKVTNSSGINAIQVYESDNVLLKKNYIDTDDIGIIVNGSSMNNNIVIEENYITGINSAALDISNVNNCTIRNNRIENVDDPVYISSFDGILIIAGNQIQGLWDGVVITSPMATADTVLIYNNMIKAGQFGIFLQDLYGAKVYHNTIRVQNNNMDAGILLSGAGSSWLRNNIIYNQGTGGTFYIQPFGSPVFDLDYNLYYTNGTIIGGDLGVGGTAIPNLNTYFDSTGREQNGLQIDPSLVSSTDLHIQLGSPAHDVGFVCGLINDFDGELREPLPDIGADEYYSGIGIFEIEKINNDFSIFPNPSTGKLTIYDSLEKIEEINVYDGAGVYIGTFQVKDNLANLESLSNGFYFLRSGQSIAKCIIAR